MVGLKPAQIVAARERRADTARDTALLQPAHSIIADQGHVPTGEFDAFKAAGLADADVLEVLVSVVLNIYPNYANHIARTGVDFPNAAPLAA